jgi:hypothetical protein
LGNSSSVTITHQKWEITRQWCLRDEVWFGFGSQLDVGEKGSPTTPQFHWVQKILMSVMARYLYIQEKRGHCAHVKWGSIVHSVLQDSFDSVSAQLSESGDILTVISPREHSFYDLVEACWSKFSGWISSYTGFTIWILLWIMWRMVKCVVARSTGLTQYFIIVQIQYFFTDSSFMINCDSNAITLYHLVKNIDHVMNNDTTKIRLIQHF